MMVPARLSLALLVLMTRISPAGASDLEPRRSWEAHGKGAFHSGIFDLAYSPDGRRLLTGSFDRSLRLWEVAEGMEVRRFEGHTDQVFVAAFAPDGRRFVSGASVGDPAARLWDLGSAPARGR